MKKILLLLLCITTQSYGVLKIDINKQSINTMPIVVADFSGVDNGFAKVIRNDLSHAGYFKVTQDSQIIDNVVDFAKFKKQNIEAVIFGRVSKEDGNFIVNVFVYDSWTQKSLYSKKINIGKKMTRRAAHFISDRVHFALLGEEGFFDSNIAYISIDKHSKLPYKLLVVDSDGFNPQVVVQSKEPIMTPRWSPNNKFLAYVSFASGKSRVYVQSVFNSKYFIKLPMFDGIASSPSWHPDGKSLLLTLSKNGNQDIYQYFLGSEKLQRITTHSGIDTEASFSHDGKKIVWTSNRLGRAQIYIKDLNTNAIKKLPIYGNYSMNASFSPDDKKIILIHAQGGSQTVSEFELATNDLVALTTNKLDESPSYAPSGKMVIYSYNKYNKTSLSVVSTTGLFGFKLSDGTKEFREPTWSKFL